MIIGNIVGVLSGSRGLTWSPYIPIKGELPNLWAKTRSGLSIADTVTPLENNISILPATVKRTGSDSAWTVDTGISPKANTIWVFSGQFLAHDRYLRQGVVETNKNFFIGGYEAIAGHIEYWFGWGNGEAYTTDEILGFNTFIMYDKRLWVVPITTALTDASILDIIANTTPIYNLTSATWSDPTGNIIYGGNSGNLFGIWFEYVQSYIGTITGGVITWQRKHIFNNTKYVYDILDISNSAAIVPYLTGVATLGHSEYGSRYCLDNGYSRYYYDGRIDLQVPYISGIPAVTSLIPPAYVKLYDCPASATKHNLADSLLDIPQSNWDRSDTTIWSSLAREASTFYDSENPNRWHISELNNLVLKNWANVDYKGLTFVKVSPNSIEIEKRLLLEGIFGYAINKTGSDINNIYTYTLDYDIIITPYILNPYNEVFKVTALSASEFKLNINDSIVYSLQDIWDKIDAMIKLNPDEDAVTTIMNWLIAHSNPTFNYFSNALNAADLLFIYNCWPDGHCGTCSLTVYNVFEHYYPGECLGYAHDWHSSGRQTNFFVELYMWMQIYKGKYINANFTEIIADPKLFTEPLRKTASPTAIAFDYHNSGIFEFLKSLPHNTLYEQLGTARNLTMKLPKDASFVFPVLSPNIPDVYNDPFFDDHFASAISTFPTGSIGEVSMPFILTQITGAGTILVDEVEYSLPSQEDDVRALFQNGTLGVAAVYSFTILTNTGGISAEYLVNRARIRLYHDNLVEEGIVSGDISVEVVPTDIPLPFIVVGVDKGVADSWTLYFDRWLSTNKSIKVPPFIDVNSINLLKVTFNKTGGMIPIPISVYTDVDKTITAGVAVIDKCFAAKLTPSNDVFDTTIELTFTSVDGSSTYYTLDGSTPSASKTLYTAPFTITETTTVKWINIRANYADSHINSRLIQEGLGPDRVDQSAWFTPAWYTSCSAHITQFMAQLSADGTSGNAIKNSIFEVGKTYRITATIDWTSGTFAISDGMTYPFVLDHSGSLTIDYLAQGSGLYVMSFDFLGKITALSIREVL
jgi:hypothetical protein